MTLAEVVLRFIVGGGVVVIVTLLAKADHPLLAGLFVLFPAVTLVSFTFLAKTSSPDAMRRITLFSIYSLPTTIAFLIAFFWGQQRMGAFAGMCIAVIVWFLVALILIVLNLRVFHI